MTYRVGDHAYVLVDSWAGLGRHLVLIEKVCPKRVKVRWVDQTAYSGQRVHGRCYYVPRTSLIGPDGETCAFHAE